MPCHFVLLGPILDLDGADYAADKLLHMVVPVLAVVTCLGVAVLFVALTAGALRLDRALSDEMESAGT